MVMVHTVGQVLDELSANDRRKVLPEPVKEDRSFLRVSYSESSTRLVFSSSSTLHGCQVDPTLAGMHMSVIIPCPIVRSKEINPSSISST